MKDKILLFIIGLLSGAIISTGIFYIYLATNDSNSCDNNKIQMQMHGGQPPEMQNGQQPPEMPNGQQPPELPSGNQVSK